MATFFIIILILGFAVAIFLAVPKMIKWHKTESLNGANRLVQALSFDESLLGKFDYTFDEWKYAHQMEFINDQNEKYWMKASSIEIYENDENHDREEIPGTIYFLPNQIIINNGDYSKTYRFNNINFAGYGTKIIWANLSNTSFMKTLEMKAKIITDEGDEFEDYNILIPSSANSEIERIYRTFV